MNNHYVTATITNEWGNPCYACRCGAVMQESQWSDHRDNADGWAGSPTVPGQGWVVSIRPEEDGPAEPWMHDMPVLGFSGTDCFVHDDEFGVIDLNSLKQVVGGVVFVLWHPDHYTAEHVQQLVKAERDTVRRRRARNVREAAAEAREPEAIP